MARPSINLLLVTTVAFTVSCVVGSRSTSSRRKEVRGARGRFVQEFHLTEVSSFLSFHRETIDWSGGLLANCMEYSYSLTQFCQKSCILLPQSPVDVSQLRRHDGSDRHLKMNKAHEKGSMKGDKKRGNKGSKKVKEKKVMEGRPSEEEEKSNFDIGDCASYSTPWLFDLAASCSDEVTFADCECPTAGALLDAGDLHCADSLTSSYACPGECEVCQVCLIAIGCKNIYKHSWI